MTARFTLADAYRRMLAGERREVSIARFLDAFYTTGAAQRRVMLEEEPPPTGNARDDALAGAMAEYLAKQYRLPKPPAWAGDSDRYLDDPWYTTPIDTPGMREYLTFASPAEFRSRNIFTEERPLRRARMPRG